MTKPSAVAEIAHARVEQERGMNTCEARNVYFGPCAEAAEARLLIGCRHEHIKERMACRWHANRVNSSILCAECFELGHRCAVLGREV